MRKCLALLPTAHRQTNDRGHGTKPSPRCSLYRKVLVESLQNMKRQFPFFRTALAARAYLPDHNSRGELRGWVASITDISESKRAEQLLQESEGRLNLPWPQADGEPGMEYHQWSVIWSSGLEKIHGLGRNLGGTVDDFRRDIHPDDWQTVEYHSNNVTNESEYYAIYRFTRRMASFVGLKPSVTSC